VFENLQGQLGKLLGGKKGEDDPQATITADQLKVVLKSIEGKYNNLKNENKLYKAKIDEQKATIGELERTVNELRTGSQAGESALLTQLEADLESARRQVAESHDTHESLRAEKLQLQSKLSVQEALVSSLRQELAELRDNQASGPTPEDLERLQAELAQAKTKNESLAARLSEVAGQLVDAEDAKQDALELKEALEAAKAETRSLKGEVKGLEEERDSLRDQLEPVQEELQGLQSRLSALQAERDDLAGEIETLTIDKEVLEGAVEALKDQGAKYNEVAAQLQQDKEELRHQIQRQQGDLQRLEEQLAGGGPQAEVIAELEERYMTAKARLDLAVEENALLQSRLQALIDEPGIGARERTELEFQIKRLSDELREAMVQISALREAKVKAHLDLEEAAAELVELRRQLDDMRRDRNFYRERWEETREEGDSRELRNQVRDLMGEVQRLKGDESVRRPIQPQAPGAGSNPLPEPRKGGAEVSGGSLARRREMLNRLIGDQKQNP
jgi:chromosome segregation ATPase